MNCQRAAMSRSSTTRRHGCATSAWRAAATAAGCVARSACLLLARVVSPSTRQPKRSCHAHVVSDSPTLIPSATAFELPSAVAPVLPASRKYRASEEMTRTRLPLLQHRRAAHGWSDLAVRCPVPAKNLIRAGMRAGSGRLILNDRVSETGLTSWFRHLGRRCGWRPRSWC